MSQQNTADVIASANDPVRVTIIGGGLGGLAAAYELVREQRPGLRFAVRVIEQRSFLGGKGASVRSNDAQLRIEEHGLHVWLGFYRRAFRMLAEIYAQLGLDLTEAFQGTRRLGFGTVGSEAIRTLPPERKGTVPWDDGGVEPLSPSNLAALALDWIEALLTDDGQLAEPASPGLAPAGAASPALAAGLEALTRAREAANTVLMLEVAELQEAPLRIYQEALAKAADAFANYDRGHPLTLAVELLAAVVKAILREKLTAPNADWRKLDHEDIDHLLARYGASEAARRSSFARGYLDLVFARPVADGGTGMAAGTGIHGMLMMIAGYRGFPVYLMSAGMGEVVFAPLYRYLHDIWGVEFRFGAQVEEIALDASGKIDCLRVRLDTQLEHDQPLEKQTIKGREVEFWKRQGPSVRSAELPPEEWRDFDELVLAVPPGAQRQLARTLRVNKRYARMLDSLVDTATISYQAWWRRSVANVASWGKDTILCAIPGELGAWADMSHLLPVENAPAQEILGLTYHCDDLRDGLGPVDRKQFFSDWLVRLGIDEVTAHLFWKENIEPTDRYVLSPAGTTESRLHPNESGFERLYLAGDWTQTSLPASCVESAVESGLMAGKALIQRRLELLKSPSLTEPTASRTRPQLRMGLRVPRGAYRLSDMRMQSLVLPARRTSLQALVDQLRPRRHHTSMVVPFGKVMLSFVEAGRTSSTHPDYATLGFGSERDVAFWIPVCVDGTFMLFAPWLWVDDPLAIAIGREVYGFNKLPARFSSVSWSDDGLETLQLHTPQPLPNGKLEDQLLLRVERSRGEIVGDLAAEDQELLQRYHTLQPPPWLTFKSTYQPGAPWDEARTALALTPRAVGDVPPIVPHASRYDISFGTSDVYDLVGDFGLARPTRDLVSFTQRLAIELGDAKVLEEDLVPFMA